ncbi:hypothetical protein [Hyphobacterium sp.]|uniref:hypothetical protein n=1 Tax=Hyphobacterium sp. TaxID=2004662 RepID=UPI003B52DA19
MAKANAKPKTETENAPAIAEKPAPYVLTKPVDGVGPKGRLIWRTADAAKDLPVRKATDSDIALAAG